MDYLSMLKASESENTLPPLTAKTAISPFGSKGSAMGVHVSANDGAPTEYRLDYSAADLAEFDQLIDRYCGVVFSHDTERQQQKREQLLAARRRMAPARVVMIELAQFRALVAEVGS